jgi:hypothetical protein
MFDKYSTMHNANLFHFRRLFGCFEMPHFYLWRESAFYSACDMLCPSDRAGKGSNIYIDILLIMSNNYFSAWGLVDDVHVRKSPI